MVPLAVPLKMNLPAFATLDCVSDPPLASSAVPPVSVAIVPAIDPLSVALPALPTLSVPDSELKVLEPRSDCVPA